MHYDVSSSSYIGATCVLVCLRHNRDGPNDLPCIVYDGVMTDDEGRPISVDDYPGNTGDPTTVSDQLNKSRTRFHLERVVVVSDRGMPTKTQIEILRNGLRRVGFPRCGPRVLRATTCVSSARKALPSKSSSWLSARSAARPSESIVVKHNPPPEGKPSTLSCTRSTLPHHWRLPLRPGTWACHRDRHRHRPGVRLRLAPLQSGRETRCDLLY